jgi:hypothetical protein
LLEGAFVGVWLVTFAFLLIRLASGSPFGQWVQGLWFLVVPAQSPLFQYLGTALLAFCFGQMAAGLVNAFVADRNEVKLFALGQTGEYLLGLLFEAAISGEPVQLTLTSRRLYVALVKMAPNLRPENYIVLLPIYTTSLDKDTLKPDWIHAETSYWFAHGIAAAADRSKVILPFKSIESAELF